MGGIYGLMFQIVGWFTVGCVVLIVGSAVVKSVYDVIIKGEKPKKRGE